MKFSRSFLSLLCASVLALCACSKEHSATDGHDHGAHAEPGALPGSYDDWCVEHEVPESRCTRCDSSLVAAFKATSDWCAEHALPESQCVQCDPKRKLTRPPKPGGK